jgi:hypothetical protein
MPSFLNAQSRFFPPGSNPAVAQTSAPATATVVKLPSGCRDYYFSHSATIATLTVWLPPGPALGDTCQLKFRSIVTALTVLDGAGAAVAGSATAATALQVQTYKFVGGVWVLW